MTEKRDRRVVRIGGEAPIAMVYKWFAPVDGRRLLRFLAVGTLNAVFGYGVFVALFLATSAPRLAIVLATILGVLFNFCTTGRLVFANADRRTFAPFVLGYTVTLAVNLLLMELLLLCGVAVLVAQALSLAALVVLGYWINSMVVFRRPA
jgi:putative flippase GtrA